MLNSFHIFANAALGKGLSGSDRIFIEFAKRLSKKYKVTVHVWEEGLRMCASQNLLPNNKRKFVVLNVLFWCKLGFVICYIARIILAVKETLFLKISNSKSTILYSASEFWMDSIPAFILKLRYPKTTWVTAWFQTAPNPLIGFAESYRKNTYKLSALLYWLMQLPIKPLIKRFADLVLVNNDLEKKQFKQLDILNRVLVILGAVNVEEINKYQKDNKLSNNKLPKVYDGVFQGRFHPQKGVLELIDIWKIVTKKLPNAKLAMIGDGPLMKNVKLQISNYKLDKNIKLFGWVFDGPKKYQIFSRSKLVVHPAFYDSGGMAAAEAMAFGLPGVGFNLDAYKSYYPKGMAKVNIGDLEGFADNIVQIITNERKRKKIGSEAQKMVLNNWSWDKRVNQLLNAIKDLGIE